MNTRFVALAVAATMGLGSVSAFAQDHYRGDHRSQGAWQHQRAEQGRRDWSNDHRYGGRGYYEPSHGYRHDSGDVVGAVLLGAITGAIVGQAANSYSYNQPPATYYNPAPYYSPAPYYTPAPAPYYNQGYGYYGN